MTQFTWGTPKEIPHLLAVTPAPQPAAAAHRPLTLGLTVLDTSRQWDRSLCDSACLGSFTERHVLRFLQGAVRTCAPSLSWLRFHAVRLHP